MAIHGNTIVTALLTKNTVTHHTYAIDNNDVVTEADAVGVGVVHAGIKAALNDPAKYEAVMQLDSDLNHRKQTHF